MKKVIFLFLMCSAFAMTAQRRTRNLNEPPEIVEKPRTGHGIGFVVSSVTGNGLAYRYWPRRIGYHMALLPVVNNDSGFLSWGHGLYYTIKEFNSNNKFYLQLGLDYVYRKERYYELGLWEQKNSISDSFNIGFGPGIETHSRYGSFSCYVGYGYYNRFYRNANRGDRYQVFLSGGISYFFEI
ncbi:MAG: hypothetical protein RLZZ262_1964 [Bacteroidota bacterium]|jgi:hypothetical protein